MADFCLDPEGWGPISSIRYAFTPCFLDGILAAIPPIFMFIGGAIQLWHFTQSNKVPNARNAIYALKIAVVFVLLALNVALAVTRWRESPMWQKDVLYWSALLKVLATLFAFGLHHLEHIRNPSPVPSAILLLYWCMTVLIDAIKLYCLIDGEIQQHLGYFALFSLVLGGETLIFLLEYLVPKGGKDYHVLSQGEEEEDGALPCPADYADIFSRWPLVDY